MGSNLKYVKRLAVTGGAGFVGSNFLRRMVPAYPDYLFINIDCLTYAGNLANLDELKNYPNYRFEKLNIRDYSRLEECFVRYDINAIIHLAAESHVDRSILNPIDFVGTNIIGTANLLELARQYPGDFRFHHISTDEVYGSIEVPGLAGEWSPYHPTSPYAASKAAADHLVEAYHKTYNLDTVITICSNNYGPYQFPEKIIPLVIRNAIDGLEIPIYGDGRNTRDWIHVNDHCRAIERVFSDGRSGEKYNAGVGNGIENIDLVIMICHLLDKKLGGGPHAKLIKKVPDRPGHDRRYALDSSRIRNELNWAPEITFEKGLEDTIDWYLENNNWLRSCLSGEYMKYYERNYLNR
nr:dTDP-glucose 4,6-dehydratase [candidate division Zixibacteria bacterium]